MKWISVKKRLPDTNRDVLVCHSYSHNLPDCTVAWINSDKKWEPSESCLEASNYDGGASISIDVDITHWSELPEPPEIEITTNIYRFNTRWWFVDFYFDGEFDSGYRGKFKTKKECKKWIEYIIKTEKEST